MRQPDSDSAFLAAGLQHFPDAHATVAAFRRLVAERVEVILNSSRLDVWRPIEVKATRAESNGLWVGAGGPMLLESFGGKTLVVDVGILWNSSHFKERVAVLAAVYSAENVLARRLEWTGDDRVRLVRNGTRQDWFATTFLGEPVDVEDTLRVVVEAAANAVASALGFPRTHASTRPGANGEANEPSPQR